MEELRFLEKLTKSDQLHPGYNHVISLLDHFRIRGPKGEQQCVVFQPMGLTVRKFCELYYDDRLPISREAIFKATPTRTRLHTFL